MCRFLCNCVGKWREGEKKCLFKKLVFQLVPKTFLETVNHHYRIDQGWYSNWPAVGHPLWKAVWLRHGTWFLSHERKWRRLHFLSDHDTHPVLLWTWEKGSEERKNHVILHIACVIGPAKQHQHSLLYRVKPWSWIVSPRIERNSLNSSLSSLLLSMSSSVN